jgi:hypothetical protein
MSKQDRTARKFSRKGLHRLECPMCSCYGYSRSLSSRTWRASGLLRVRRDDAADGARAGLILER